MTTKSKKIFSKSEKIFIKIYLKSNSSLVGNIPFDVTQNELIELFETIGPVIELK